MKIPAWLEGLLLTACLTWTFPLQATIIPVTSLADSGSGSLREAVGLAASGDTIDIVIAGTIAFNSQIFITDTITIRGLSPGESTMSGQDQCRLFEIPDGGSLFLENFTLENGNADIYIPFKIGGVALVNGSISVSNCVFHNNVAAAGGAVFLGGSNGLSPTGSFTNCCFYNNQAVLNPQIVVSRSGGALYGDGLAGGDSFIEAYNCTFSGNYALLDGGAIFIVSRGEGKSRFLGRSCTITDNQADRFGGGVDNSSAFPVDIANTIISGNHSSQDAEDLYGTVSSQGHNIIGTGPLDFSPEPTDIIASDPLLGPLGNHGSVLLTHVPQCLSPAVDQADPVIAPAEDLRGEGRLNLPDIGSHELVPEVDVVVRSLASEGPNSLREVILLSCLSDTIDLAEIAGTIFLTQPFRINKNVIIKGNQQSGVVIHGNDSVRLVEIVPPGRLYASDLTFSSGRAKSFGGGAILNKGDLSLERCAVIFSQAEAGGAVSNYGDLDTARVDLLNCTLSENRATDYAGGAIDNRAFSHAAFVKLTNCTVANNEAAFQGGGISNDPNVFSQVSMINTLLAQNLSEQGPDLFGDFVSQGHNLIENGSRFEINTTSTDLIGISASLDPLETWDGVTPTHRLQDNSPAIDAGDNSVATSTDQRGRIRVYNGQIDIGAYEYDPATHIQNDSRKPYSHSFSVYPNPVRGVFTIKSPVNYQKAIEVDLIDLQGRLIYSWIKELDQMNEVVQVSFELPKLRYSSSIYWLKISTTSGTFWEKISVFPIP